jgi:hypothetical protein
MEIEQLEQLLQDWNRVVEQFSTYETPLILTVTAVESTDLEAAWGLSLVGTRRVYEALWRI